MLSRRKFLHTAAAGAGGIVMAGAVAGTAAAQPRGKAVPLAPPNRESPDAKMPEVVKRKLGIAIVGLGKLAIEEVLPAFASTKYCEPVAFVSGHAAKAKQLASVYGVPADAIYDYASIGKLAQNPRVDATYIILPNSMHAEYTIKSFEAGKHVLCEKPMATSPDEALRMIKAAKDKQKQLMIAYRLQYEPTHLRAIELCRKELGKVKVIDAANCQTTNAPNIRLSKALGGGPVQDVGIYCINAFRYLTGEEPIEVTAMEHRSKEPRFAEVPESVAFTLRFPSGVLAQGYCSFGTMESRRCRVTGADGFLELDNAFAYRGIEMHVQRKGAKTAKELVEPVIEEQDQFALELDHFARSILDGKPVRTPGEDGLADLRVIAAIEEAARTGKPVRIAS